MFKSLRRKLFGFEKKLERQLEDAVEEELKEARHEVPTPAPGASTTAPGSTESSPKTASATEPAAPATVAATTQEPATYKEAKRRGMEDEAAKVEETIEERLEREVTAAADTQEALEEAAGDDGRRVVLDAEVMDDLLWDLEVGLLESDVAMPVIEAIKTSVREQLMESGVPAREPAKAVRHVLWTAMRRVLQAGDLDFDDFVSKKLEAGKRPVVIMFVGVNGTGKTTTIAKIAHRLKGQNISSVLAAGDTFRAGAIEQLSTHAERLGVRIVKHTAGSDPAAVAFDAIQHAKSRRKDVVLLDTAGRMQTNTNLMAEMAKIKRVARPDMVLFVGDALAGNDAVEQARAFNKVVGIDAVVLTKVDADAKGGAALSVAYTIGKPLLFVGTGQEYDDQMVFDVDWMMERLFENEA